MSPTFLAALINSELARAAEIGGFFIPREAELIPEILQAELSQLKQDPGLEPWSLRAIILRDEQVMAGYIGFHSRPGPRYLQKISPGGVELRYEVFPPYHFRGIADEAITALMRWAYIAHQVRRFVLTSPPGKPSNSDLARALHFEKKYAHFDPRGGLEDLFERYLPELPPEWD